MRYFYEEIWEETKIKIIVLCALLCLFATGCSSTGLRRNPRLRVLFENTQEEPVDIYVSSASGVVKRVDKQAQTITICELNQREEKTLSMMGQPCLRISMAVR